MNSERHAPSPDSARRITRTLLSGGTTAPRYTAVLCELPPPELRTRPLLSRQQCPRGGMWWPRTLTRSVLSRIDSTAAVPLRQVSLLRPGSDVVDTTTIPGTSESGAVNWVTGSRHEVERVKCSNDGRRHLPRCHPPVQRGISAVRLDADLRLQLFPLTRPDCLDAQTAG